MNKNITPEQIEKIREKYPVSFDELCRHSSFEQVFGRNRNEYTSEEKKRRWDRIISLSNNYTKRYWNDDKACMGCFHLKDFWCKLEDMPCMVCPILSFVYGVSGMACGGGGYVPREPELFNETPFDSDLPF